jgi:hypothetical protein
MPDDTQWDNLPWGPIRSILAQCFEYDDIVSIVAYMGLPMNEFVDRSEGYNKGRLLHLLEEQFHYMDSPKKKQFATIVVEEMLHLNPALEERIGYVLSRLGWSIVDGRILALELVDRTDVDSLPQEGRDDLVKAATRFRDGDLSGAISAACGAVDSITGKIYLEKNLGDPGPAAFQEKVARSLEATGILTQIESDLVQLNWEPAKARQLTQNLKGSLNQASLVMQTLRSRMGDVHGTKATLKALVFDSLQWSKLILRIFTERS